MPPLLTLSTKAEKKKGKAFFLIMLGPPGKKVNQPPVMMRGISQNLLPGASDHL
jgi:hypothetical protein